MKTLFLILFLSINVLAQGQTPVHNFNLLNVVDGKGYSFESFPVKAWVVIFTSNTCPYDAYYLSRIRTLVQDYAGKVQFILINSCPGPEESAYKMKEIYGQWNLPVPYLEDKVQEAMNNFGAKKSPEVFLVSGAGNQYQVYYRGAIDDNAQSETAVTENYLKAAIDNLLSGNKGESVSGRVVGCTIRKN